MGLLVGLVFERTTKVVRGSDVSTDCRYDFSQGVLHQVGVFTRILVPLAGWTRDELRNVLLRQIVNDLGECRAVEQLPGAFATLQDCNDVGR
jgi:hypothetical protein